MSETKTWQPWHDSIIGVPNAFNHWNSMSGPPCKECIHWNPQVKFMHTPKGYVYDGVRCCHAGEMQADFSCFRDVAVTGE